jgi:glycosyltransferase involved in cell wall biosynthesis
MRIKILFVIDALEFGGGERCFAQIINGLPTEQYEIFLASAGNYQFYDAIKNAQVHKIPLDFSSKYNPFLLTKVTNVIKEENIDIVNGQGARAEFYARIASGRTGTSKYISTIATPVEGYDVDFLKKRLYRFLDRFPEKYVDRFIVVSDALKDLMIHQRRISAEKVVKIYNGIEINHYDPDKLKNQRLQIRNEFILNDDVILIGAIGRLVWQKGFTYFLRCIPDIIKHIAQTRFVIVGDGEMREYLQNVSKKLGIENYLFFTGQRSDIMDILAATDIIVIPSLQEGFPMITLEAMAMKKPIIATRINGITEQISDSVEGILVEPRNASALTIAIKRLVENPELATSLGEAARKRVIKDFSVEKMISETKSVYESLCQN